MDVQVDVLNAQIVDLRMQYNWIRKCNLICILASIPIFAACLIGILMSVHHDVQTCQQKIDNFEQKIEKIEQQASNLSNKSKEFHLKISKEHSFLYPSGIVVAVTTKACPNGFREQEKATGRVIIGKGLYTQQKHDGWTETVDFKIDDLGGEAYHFLKIEEMPNHLHNITIIGEKEKQHLNWTEINFDFSTKHKPIFSTTSPEGKNMPHNNMQPYIALTYCISN